MKLMDDVRIVNLKESYEKKGITTDLIGTIISGEIRDNSFLVIYPAIDVYKDDDKFIVVKIEDLELVNDNHASDEEILEDLPKHNPKWWCKVEDGYILNLLGEKKNKIPYDYNS